MEVLENSAKIVTAELECEQDALAWFELKDKESLLHLRGVMESFGSTESDLRTELVKPF